MEKPRFTETRRERAEVHGSVIITTGHGSVIPPISAWISLSRRDHGGTTTAFFRALRIGMDPLDHLASQCPWDDDAISLVHDTILHGQFKSTVEICMGGCTLGWESC